ncbi:MAG TPA: Hsp20/alpha crystallin family protein [Rhodopseudomonas sp.]|uniref:Hsp20/alpha crystallin family protein n=1 Tax=Rhodopseudomonas sp. TaxID=1078 RepID=UPI002ED7B614
MNVRDIIPWTRGNAQPLARYEGETSPFLSLHREVNRLFDDAFRGFDVPAAFARLAPLGGGWPKLEISDTDKELKITADVPGLEEKDIEVLLDDGALTLRGEKTSETNDKERQFSERFYGRFERRIPLDYEVAEDKVTAAFKNGVLTVTLPKTERAATRSKKIAINSQS